MNKVPSRIILLILIANLTITFTSPSSALSHPSKPSIGLALGGGGTRGYAHIGVLKVFKRENIPIDLIVGTSMGSVVGGLYCAGLSPEKIEKLLRSKAFQEASELSVDKLDLFVLPIAVVPKALTKRSYSGLYKGNKFANFISKNLPRNRKTIEELPIQFGAVVFDLLEGKSHVLKSGDLGKAVQASSAVPELRQPVPLNGMLLVDGGVTDNLPCKLARQLKPDLLIAVNVDERLYPEDDNAFFTIGSVSNRCVTANLARLDYTQEKLADIVIHPEVSSIKLLSKKELDIERAIKAGERAAEEALLLIKEKLKVVNKSKPNQAKNKIPKCSEES